MRRPGTARALRGLVAGSLTAFLALLFHVLGGGAVPPPLAIAGAFAGAIWLSMLIGRRRRSLAWLVAAIAVSQLLLHTLFSIASGSADLVASGPHAEHGGGLMLATAHDGQSMWWAHIMAGLLTVVVIRRGETLLLRLGALAAMLVSAVLRAVRGVVIAAPPARILLVSRSAVASPGVRVLASVVVRRGPPVAFG